MANVYATLADGGWRNKQITITKVVFPDGRVDRSWGVPHRVKVLSTAAAAVETEILQHNVQYGTATRSAIGCPTAAKTGTTSGLVDAWLDGYTPNRATVVWMGYEKANISMTDVHGQAQFGGLICRRRSGTTSCRRSSTPPCAPLPDPAADPMTYVPFTGHYQEARASRAYVPPAHRGDRRRPAPTSGPTRPAAPHAHHHRRRPPARPRRRRPSAPSTHPRAGDAAHAARTRRDRRRSPSTSG